MIGEGSYEFLIADQGGLSRLGAVTGVVSATITRPRDDTSRVTMHISPQDVACRSLLADVRTVRNELVVYRDGVRLWEGPITRLAYYRDHVELDASDITWYLSRRVLQENVDFTGRSVNAIDFIHDLIIRHYPDPDRFNIRKYVTKVNSPDDAKTAAKFPAYSRTLFEMLDKYAEDGGIDYIVNGRMLIIYDTHCRAHVLPRLTESDFASELGVVEYGSELVTRAVSSNGSDSYSIALAPTEWTDYYGYIDKVSTSTQESGGGSGEALKSSAEREMFSGYPAPVDILVPSGSKLDQRVGIPFDNLLPGGWLPVEVTSNMRKSVQWQRISEVRVEIGQEGESVMLTLQQPPAKWVEPFTAGGLP